MLVSPRSLSVVAVGLVVLWLIVSVTAAGVFRTRSPDLVLKVAPYDGGARAIKAFALLSQPDVTKKPAAREARTLISEAIAKEPTSLPAVRSLGLLLSLNDKPGAAARVFHYAESLSRRDLATQLWLIEWNVRQDDVAGALKHYDIALRTSPETSRTLFPILIAATAFPDVAAEVRRMLLTRPSWGPMFVRDLVYGSKSPAVAASISRGLLNPANVGERPHLVALMERLVQARSYNQAWALYTSIRRSVAEESLVRDGSFEDDDTIPPFEWALAQEPDLSAELRPRIDDTNKALYFVQTGGRAGTVARQLLRLAPGRYTLSMLAGEVKGDTERPPQISLNCAGNDTALVAVRLPMAPSREQRQQMSFEVGRACHAQWIAVTVPGSLDTVESSGWIDDVSIRRVG